MEEYAYVLDYLPYGKSTDRMRTPLAYLIGEMNFTLLEVIPKKNVVLEVDERVFVGKGEREKIEKIKRRVDYEELTTVAKENLLNVVKKLVKSREQEMVRFFNNVKPLNIRIHQLELLPGIGKKHMEDFLAERQKKPFESFEEIKKRIPLFPDPVHILAQRIMQELSTKGMRYYLFVRPMLKDNNVSSSRQFP